MANENNQNVNVQAETKANQAAVKSTEHLEIVLKLTEAQYKALKDMDKLDKKAEAMQGAIDARIKGAYKAYKDKAEKAFESLYDKASKSGFKTDQDKKTFVDSYMKQVNATWSEL